MGLTRCIKTSTPRGSRPLEEILKRSNKSNAPRNPDHWRKHSHEHREALKRTLPEMQIITGSAKHAILKTSNPRDSDH